ncbi:TRIM3 [Branchiostoma lanceolatum]|uniref:TRIM3 protein n=1 Tax=Branchiostoma lanceolatum TaxID=7740 RepID=A0A8K0EVW2_BRALA|nr:TRIM3 [Branchiostoma lanceolatum]
MDAMNTSADDYAYGAGPGIPDNMDEADLQIRDPSDSTTTDPVYQQHIQPQLHRIPTSPEEQTDIATGYTEDPLQDDHSGASAGYSEQDGCSHNGVERSSLPTVCSSYIDTGQTEQNQALYVDRPNQDPSTDCSAENGTERLPPPTMCTSYANIGKTEQNQALYVDRPNQDPSTDCSAENGTERLPPPTICTSYTNVGKSEQNQALYGEKPSLPTVCTLDTHVDQAEQNQALYVDNAPVETEETPSKDLYDTDACNADNVVQYQLKDTCRKEASATTYQSSGDGATVDRPGVTDHDANRAAGTFDLDGTPSEPVIKQLKDPESSDHRSKSEDPESSDHRSKSEDPESSDHRSKSGDPESSDHRSKSEDGVTEDDECIRPYAVAYKRDGETNDGGEDDVYDVQPYAVAYDQQDGHYENQTPTGRSVNNSQSVPGQANTSSEGSVDGRTDGLIPNPMYSRNALRPNPVYAPNVAQPKAGGGHRCVASRSCLALVITAAVAVAALTVLTALIIATVFPAKKDSHTQTTFTDPSFTSKTTDDVIQHVDYTSSPQTSTEENENHELKQRTIYLHGENEDPPEPAAVVVSPSNEIFVADTFDRRVLVFSMAGVYLRHFPTIVPGEDSGTIEPEYISIDGEGHLWVAGDKVDSSGALIGRYTSMGDHLTTLHPSLPSNAFCGMAVDTARNHVVLTELWEDYGEVKLLYFNGTVVRRFRMQQGSGYPGLVALGREGNLFVSDCKTQKRVYAYNATGHYLFRFDGHATHDDQAMLVGGICTDRMGNLLVANWYDGTVELFTQAGRYVRRVAAAAVTVDGVAVGPGGQLAVTSEENGTVTIFSHY